MVMAVTPFFDESQRKMGENKVGGFFLSSNVLQEIHDGYLVALT